MLREEIVQLTVADLESAVKAYVKAHYPEFEGTKMRASIYPNIYLAGPLDTLSDNDRERDLIRVAISKDSDTKFYPSDRLIFTKGFVVTLSDVEDLDELIEAVDEIEDAYTRGYLIATVEEQSDSLEYDEICKNLIEFATGYMED